MAASSASAGDKGAHPHSAHVGTPLNSGEKRGLAMRWREDAYLERRCYPAYDGPLETF